MIFPVQTLKETILLRELSMFEYKELLKIIYGDDPSEQIFVETVLDILSRLADRPKLFFERLSVCDILLIFLQIRIQTFGDSASIHFIHQEKQSTLELSLEHIKQTIRTYYTKFGHSEISFQQMNISLSPPSLRRLLTTKIEDPFSFVSSITMRGTTMVIQEMDSKEEQIIFDHIPVKTSSKIIAFHRTFVENLKDSDLLARYSLDKTLIFIPTITSLIFFIKLLFNESIETLYDNLFFLSYRGHLDGKFLDACTPGEYIFFAKKLQEVLTKQAESTEATPLHSDENLPEDLRDSWRNVEN